ncbi:MAG: disease resistance protein [Sulfurimonas sp.]|nr:MAG: disease resistance protein [Sulfurimonas sp.]
MSFRKKTKEIKRLINSFTKEADKFHSLTFSTYSITQQAYTPRKFLSPNHVIMLWQYYGQTNSDSFLENLKDSNLKWGVRGAELSSFGVIEGKTTDLFIKMAQRAGCLFNKKEKEEIKNKTFLKLLKAPVKDNLKSIGVTNDNSIATWLNYLLYYLSIMASKNEEIKLTQIDPYTLSLFALEQLQDEHSIEKVDKSVEKLENIEFDVAFSFPGERRKLVSNVADIVRKKLKKDKLFYDFDYQSQLARPNIDVLLQKIYHKNSKLIVIFLSSEYMEKEWSGLEWRAIRDLIKSKKDDKIMFVKFDDKEIDGLFSIDGYIDATYHSEKAIARFILERVELHNT